MVPNQSGSSQSDSVLNKQWDRLEHQIYRFCTSRGIRDRVVLLGLSGGLDSVALTCILSRLAPALNLKPVGVYLHHGTDQNSEQNHFRDQCEEFAKNLCTQLKIDFKTFKSEQNLQSEEDMRNFRQQHFMRLADEFTTLDVTLNSALVFLAHHQDDLLETRLMRLIRGTGGLGLKSMDPAESSRWVRPFLDISKQELKKYLESRKQTWIEDPSNNNTDYFRNWIRTEWLPSLERFQTGSTQSLAHSLELIVEQLQTTQIVSNDKGEKTSYLIQLAVQVKEGIPVIDRSVFITLSIAEQRQLLAEYMLSSLGARNTTQNHIREVMRRLDKNQLEHTFNTGGLNWTVTKSTVSAESIKTAD